MVLSCLVSFCVAQQLMTYPSPGVLPASTDFIIKARTPGQTWKEVPVSLVQVADAAAGVFSVREVSMASFDFSGTVEIAVTSTKGKFRSARIRPLSYGIKPEVTDTTLHFSINQPRNISIELDGDIFHNLQLFAGAIEKDVPDKSAAGVLYYGPGVHDVGTIHLTSGQQVYLAGGAVVMGRFLIDHQNNIRISGRGILYQPRGGPVKNTDRPDAIRMDAASNVTVEGITMLSNTYAVLMGESRHIQIRNIKSFSAGGNNDGIDVFSSEDVLIDGVFMRNADDCIAIYGHRWNYYGNVSNVTVRNSTLWADVAHPILVGTHGDPQHPDTLEGLHFINIDILDHQENQMDYQGCMSLNAGDSNLIRHVRFEDIRVEDFRKGQLVNLRIMYNRKYNTAPGKGIEDVLFKDITYTGSHAGTSIIAGYDDTHLVQNIRFENLRINGKVFSDTMAGKPAWYQTSDMAGFFVGEHVINLQFLTPASSPKSVPTSTGEK